MPLSRDWSGTNGLLGKDRVQGNIRVTSRPGSRCGRGLRKVRFLVHGEGTQADAEPKVAQLPSSVGSACGTGLSGDLGEAICC